MGGPGKTAPLLLHDLLTYDPRYEDAAQRNLLTTAPPHHDPRAAPKSAVPYRNCRHDLQLKDTQSAPPQRGTAPAHTTVYKVAAYCKLCRWHFDLWVDFRSYGSQNSPCTKLDSEFPLHHFLFVDGPNHHVPESLGARNKSRTYKFSCSAPRCPTTLRIRISPPRLSDANISLLTDPAILRRRWEQSKLISGDRADTDRAQPIDAPNYLNTYLHDSFNPQKGKTRIPLLNRKFLKTFGRDCDDILTRLGFTFAAEQDQEGVITEGWYLPKPSDPGDPLEEEASSTRDIIEDTRYELNAIILSYPEPQRSTARRNPLDLVPARSYIELALGCDDYALREGGRRETRGASREEDHPYYAGLGALADFADSLLIFAFRRQVDVDPSNTPYYFECLKDLAKGRQSEALLTESVTLESLGFVTRDDVTQAYRTLGIDPSHAHALSDELITSQFSSRLSDISRHQVQEARNALRIVGIARESELIKRTASGTIETYQEALTWLNLPDTAVSTDDMVISMYTSKLIDHPAEEETAKCAVKIIAKHRGSTRLQQWLETGDLGASEMDAAEAYATLNIPDRSAKLDLGMLEAQVSLMMSDNPENQDRLRTAVKIVRQDQDSTYGAGQEFGQVHDLKDWPVGCRNIGNTCYLNSVLQFLFTIKPLRNMVMEGEDHFQELSPEALASKRVGRTAVSRARAETAQQFVRELRNLFQQMITASTHNVQPDRSLAALALTRGESLDAAKESSTGSAATHSGLGKIGDEPVSGPMLPPGFPTDSRPPTPADSVIGNAEGDTDSMNAMDFTTTNTQDVAGTATIQPEQPSRPPPIPPRPHVDGDIGLRKLEEVARQQDASEILNNVFDLLSCAFRGEDTLRDGEQLDLIKRLFFSDVTSVRRDKEKEILKTDLQDTVHISAKDRDRSLCAALDEEFGSTEVEAGVTKYEFFEQAAPIQIINVQRLLFQNGETRKDLSHIALPKDLYMDRYLKKTASLSAEQLHGLRTQQWRLQEQKLKLENRMKLLKETDFKTIDLPAVLDETARALVNLKSHQLEESHESPKSDQDQEQDVADDVSPEPISEHLSSRANELRPELAQIEKQIQKLEGEIESVFEHCRDHPYKLHAVFMHAGSHAGGHYWIYIHDFQRDVWRKYNDETVTEVSEEAVLEKISQDRPPTSTGIVYVRADVTNEFTEAVHRKPEAEAKSGAHGDVEMTDAPSTEAMSMDQYTSIETLDGQEAHHRREQVGLLNSAHSYCTSPPHLFNNSSVVRLSPEPLTFFGHNCRMESDQLATVISTRLDHLLDAAVVRAVQEPATNDFTKAYDAFDTQDTVFHNGANRKRAQRGVSYGVSSSPEKKSKVIGPEERELERELQPLAQQFGDVVTFLGG